MNAPQPSSPPPAPAAAAPRLARAAYAFLNRLRPWRALLVLLLDAGAVALAWQATYLFRLGFDNWWRLRPDYDGWVLAAVIVAYAACSVALGVPRAVWRFVGFGELQRLGLVCLLAGALAGSAVQMAGLTQVPRAVLALHPLMALLAMAGLRLGYRMAWEHLRAQLNAPAGAVHRALVLGAGEAARLLIAGIQHQGWRILGLLDDDPDKQRSRVAGLPVLGPLDELPAQARVLGATHVIVAMPGEIGRAHV